jgi:hypothetical protein
LFFPLKCAQTGFNNLVNILINKKSATDIPAPPTEAELTHFRRRFSSMDEWDDFFKTITGVHDKAARMAIDFQKSLKAKQYSRKTTAAALRKVSRSHLEVIFGMLLNSGLTRFAPDWDDDSTSMYNTFHQDLAVAIFKRIAIRTAFWRDSVDLTVLNDTEFLCRLYRHVIWHVVKGGVSKKEVLGDDGLEQERQVRNAKARRKDVRQFCFWFSGKLTRA